MIQLSGGAFSFISRFSEIILDQVLFSEPENICVKKVSVLPHIFRVA